MLSRVQLFIGAALLAALALDVSDGESEPLPGSYVLVACASAQDGYLPSAPSDATCSDPAAKKVAVR
jgi:hypothetical protein